MKNSVGGIIETHIPKNAVVFDAKITLEPVLGGVRVTARNGQNQTLWGFSASKKDLESSYCNVGIHPPLKDLISQELMNNNEDFSYNIADLEKTIKEAEALQNEVKKTLKALKILKPTEITFNKANILYKTVEKAKVALILDNQFIQDMSPEIKELFEEFKSKKEKKDEEFKLN